MTEAFRTEPAKRAIRAAFAALTIGVAAGALSALPLGQAAFAKNSGDHGGGNGGGNGGGHSGDHGGGNGNGGGGNGNGNGGGDNGNAGGRSNDHPGGNNPGGGNPGDTSDDGSLSPSGLGKLNGFFHASPQGLANASPESAIGKISKTLKDALSKYGEASQTPPDPNDPNAAPQGPTTDDLGAILADATNKTVTGAQVKAIIDRLADQNPDDAGLGNLAANADDATCQGIADAANAAKAGSTAGSSSDGTDSTDAGTGDTTGSATTLATN